MRFCIFTADQIRCSKYIYLPRIMPGSESMCRKQNLESFLEAICTADQWLWVPNGSSVSASEARSGFNLVAKGILGPGRRCNKNSPNLCAKTVRPWSQDHQITFSLEIGCIGQNLY